MGKEGIVEKKPKSIFELMQERHEAIWERMRAMDKWFDDSFKGISIKEPTVINMGDMNTFKSSIEKFQEQHPNAKIKASAYVYSTGAEPQMFKYETTEEKPKLEKPKKKSKGKKKK